MTENNNTITQVVKDGLCTGCGTCIALCPNEAIELTINEKKGFYVPELNEGKCNNCGICYEVCPGHSVDFKQLNLEIFGKEPSIDICFRGGDNRRRTCHKNEKR
jgi:coenzyme F420 hydrogenase subunit beta